MHDQLSALPGLPAPEWQLRAKWLLRFEGAAIARADEQAFWQAQGKPDLTPLVDSQALIALAAQCWRRQLIATGFLVPTPSGWRWAKAPIWYPDYAKKLAAIADEM